MTMKNSRHKESTGIKRAPQRTCVGCRQIKNKREMVRLVRLPDGRVEVDDTAKKNGRGAYICPTRDCWDKALAGKQLERTLKTVLSDTSRRELGISSQSLIRGEN